jgi:iron(III) transport system permease protein
MAVVISVMMLAIVPALPLVIIGVTTGSDGTVWSRSFVESLSVSLTLSAGVACLCLMVGFPLGLLAALYRCRLRVFLILLQAMPLLVPSFLLAIGWSDLVSISWLSRFLIPAGLTGTTLVLGMQSVPLVFFTTLVACRNLTATQIDAARLLGGESLVLRLSAQACYRPATMAALLAGVLSLSDSGAALILGGRVAAVEILTSFSSLFDFGLAARQCLLLAGVVLLLLLPLLVVGLRAFAVAVLARQTRAPASYSHRGLGRLTTCGLIAVFFAAVGIPAAGLCLPVMNNPMLARAAQEIQRTVGQTVVYSGAAALIAVFLSTSLALAVRDNSSWRLAVLGILLVVFTLPPALAALGVVQMATNGPPQLDWLTRSQFTVSLLLGLRFFPIATLVMMRAVGSLATTWTDAARLHGVPRTRFQWRVILPILKPALAASFVLVVVLATADITTVMLLHPPGRMSLPVALFTVMANSPEGLVASLCLLYLAGVTCLIAVTALCPLWTRGNREAAR